jgi:hypothetical protein
MVENMKETISMIRRKVKELSTGQMEGNTKVAGRMESNMETDSTRRPAVKLNKEDGMRERDFIGFKIIKVMK